MSVHCPPKIFAAVAKAEISSRYDNYFEVMRLTEPNLVETVNGSPPLPGVIREHSALRRCKDAQVGPQQTEHGSTTTIGPGLCATPSGTCE